ncbi:glycosyltransferase family 2 protein [Candidatus Pelagibacter sp.]|nr:glycosyltransferase family 2 protein [Candidatus Pelagibacter sp.]
MSTYSIIIPTYNNPTQVKRCIKSIIKNFEASKSQYEIIIVDDASKTNNYNITKKFIRNFKKKKISLIRNKKNLGPAQSRNVGAKKAKFKNLLFLDSDTVLHKDISKNIQNNLRKYDAVIGHYYYKPINETIAANFKAIFNYFFFSRKGITKFETFNSACAAIKKKVFNKLKGFNANIKWGMDYENEEFGRRILKNNTMVIDPKITVMHEFPALLKMLSLYFKRAIPYVGVILDDKKVENTGPAGYKIIFSIILSLMTTFGFFSYLFLSKKIFLYFFLTSFFLYLLNNLNFIIFSLKIKPLQTPAFIAINFLLGKILFLALIVGSLKYIYKIKK